MSKAKPKTTASPKPNAETKAGRPEGSPNVQRDSGEVQLSRCKKCDSTDREKYFGTPTEFAIAGVKDGKPYTHIVRKRTKCSNCGQQRLDSFYENRVVKPAKSKG